MEMRILAGQAWAVSVVRAWARGNWALTGATWTRRILAVLEAAAATGTTFLTPLTCTGRASERIIGQSWRAIRSRSSRWATKMGRRVAQDPAFFTLDNFRA